MKPEPVKQFSSGKPQRFSRWTFWGWGSKDKWGEIYCFFCKGRTYNSIFKEGKWFCKDKNCYGRWKEDGKCDIRER